MTASLTRAELLAELKAQLEHLDNERLCALHASVVLQEAGSPNLPANTDETYILACLQEGRAAYARGEGVEFATLREGLRRPRG